MPSYGSLVINLVAGIAPTFSNGGVFTISSKNFGDAPFTPAYPTSNSLGAFTYTSSATSVATVNATTGVVTIVAAGTATIRATQAAAGGYSSGYVEASVTINLIAPTFSNGGVFTISSKNFGDAPFTPAYPTSNSLGAFTYTSSATSVATVNATTGVVTIVAAGTAIIRATQAAAGVYASGYVEASVTINPIAPTFSDGGVFTISSKNFGDAPFTPAYPTSNSLGAFTYTSSATSVATVNATTGVVTIVATGSATIRATQAAAGGYASGYVEASLVMTPIEYRWLELGADIDGQATDDCSGRSVSLSADGSIVAIGALLNNGNGSNSGQVRVYQRDASKTVAQTNQSLPNYGPIGWNRLGADIDGEATDDYSGVSVSLSADGSIVAIGALYNDGNVIDSNCGQVRVYKYDASKITEQPDQSLPNFGPIGWNRLGADIDGEATDDQSGVSVSLSADGSIVAIGAAYNAGNDFYNGQVRVYQRDASKTVAQPDQSLPNFGPVGWNRLGADIDGELASDYSGQSVSLSADGTIVAIGAPYNDGNGSDSGHVRVYQRDASKVTAQTNQSLPNFGPIGWNRLGADIDGETEFDNSGQSVSLSADGTIVAIGVAYNAGISSDSNSGHVRVYKYDASKTVAQTNQSLPNYGPVGWNRLGADIDGELASDNSGYSVSLSADGSIVAIGALYNDGNVINSNCGQVRVYKYDASKITEQINQSLPNFGPIGWNRLGADIDGELPSDYSGSSVSLSADGTIVAIGAYGNDANGSSSGQVRVYKSEIV